MKQYFNISVLILLFFLAVASLTAQVGLDKVGQSAMNFQLVTLSPRASALGDAVFAISTGADAIFSNPAGLSEMKKERDLSLMYTAWIADIQYMAGAFAWNFGDAGTIGISALGVDYGAIYATRLLGISTASPLSTPYEDLGEMNNIGAYSFGVSYARAISQKFSIGGTMRYTGQNLGESLLPAGVKQNDAAVMVFDVGVKYNTGFRSFRFAMAFRNFSKHVLYEKIEEQLPLTFTLATAMDVLDVFDPSHSQQTSLLLGVDYLHSNNFSERMNFGLEYQFHGMLALRGGYQTNRDIASWSAGVGVCTSVEEYDVRVDYSYSAAKYFADVSRISIGLGF